MNAICKLIFGILISVLFSFSAYAGEIVRWTGTVSEEDGYHYNEHEFGHSLEFIRQNDGKSFDVVDSQELEAVHIQKEKNLLVEIEAEKTDRFLFWGGNLIVKNFKVLDELDEIPHREYKRPAPSTREYGKKN